MMWRSKPKLNSNDNYSTKILKVILGITKNIQLKSFKKKLYRTKKQNPSFKFEFCSLFKKDDEKWVDQSTKIFNNEI